MPAVLHAADGLTVRIQLLDPAGYPRWPTETTDLIQRYDDAPPARLMVPTRAALTAAKTVAWHDRHAPRDLYDLWGLSIVHAIDTAAAALFASLGPTGNVPRGWIFRDTPSTADWTTQLGYQTRIAVSAHDAVTTVRKAWELAAHESGGI
ncbi:MAG TPA: nucleotidyl transferase AbiEii/AbiGii toxin family protein [Mycobacteriales bacterium]|nr:nucleotidyl transferase AbiEii/AbiGii toxin family protein [Mycobacteriales bacterium]